MRRIVLVCLLVAVMTVGCQVAWGQTLPAGEGSKEICTVIDTDLALDDFRAIAMVLGQRKQVSFVVSEGVADTRTSVQLLESFLTSISADSGTNVFVGRLVHADVDEYYRDHLSDMTWMVPVRNHFAAALKGDWLHVGQRPFKGREFNPGSELEFVRTLSDHCSTVEVLMLGPATNFVHYAPLLGMQVSRIVVEMGMWQGLPSERSFNCYYDWPSCMKLGFLKSLPRFEFADSPHDPSFGPSAELILSYRGSRIGDALIRLHQVETSWCDGSTSMWDDSAAAYLLGLVTFVQDANGLRIPSVTAKEFWRAERLAVAPNLPQAALDMSHNTPQVCSPPIPN